MQKPYSESDNVATAIPHGTPGAVSRSISTIFPPLQALGIIWIANNFIRAAGRCRESAIGCPAVRNTLQPVAWPGCLIGT